jgi:hypothetical protein
MSKTGINNSLKRNLRKGSQYDSLFQNSTCKSTYLGKGDTYTTIDLIKESILKYHSQTNKIAPLLKKPTLNKTIASIYDFWYNHIQYKADGVAQNLKSPACLWSSKVGDCKSFTIAVGCTLSNLGIKYYIRKIRQASLAPSQFTHVYIVVPHNQDTANLKDGYGVIDPTKHTNIEASFIGSPKNILMDNLTHNGLNAASVSTSPTAIGIKRHVKSADRTRLLDAFKFLEKLNANPDNIQAAKEAALSIMDSGVIPVFNIQRQGIVIGSTLYPYTNGESRLFRSPKNISQERESPIGLNSGFGDKGFGDNWFNPGGGNSGGGNSANDWIDESAMGDEISNLADSITSGGWWDSTIGQVLGNGWQLSCWGASNSPKKSAQEVSVDFPAYVAASGLNQLVNTNTVNTFVSMIMIYMANRLFGINNGEIAQCTRDGNQAGYTAMGAAYGEILATLIRILRDNGGELRQLPTQTYTLTEYSMAVPSGYHDGVIAYGHNNVAVEIPVYEVLPPIRPVVIPISTGGSVGGATIPINAGPPPTQGLPTPPPSQGSPFVPTYYCNGRPQNTPCPRPKPFTTAAGAGLAPRPVRPGSGLVASEASTSKIIGVVLLAALGYRYYESTKKGGTKKPTKTTTV